MNILPVEGSIPIAALILDELLSERGIIYSYLKEQDEVSSYLVSQIKSISEL